MKSMTGFGSSEYHVDGISITVEVRSYNNRFLDVSVSLPPGIASLEPALRGVIAGGMSRGRVDVQIRLTGTVKRAQVRIEGVKEAIDLLKSIASAAEVNKDFSVQDILDVDQRFGLGLVEANGSYVGEDSEVSVGVLEATKRGLEHLNAERHREGKELTEDLVECLGVVKQEVDALSGLAAAWQVKVERDVQARMDRLLTSDDISDRVVPAVALLLTRSDVNEELKRLFAHLNGMGKGMANAEGPHGKKLEFYCQELLREVNTIGAKASSSEVDQHVLTVKEQVERMREQLRNVE